MQNLTCTLKNRLRPRGEQYLARWAFSQLHDIDALSRMVDPSLAGAYPTKSLSRLADIVSLCIQVTRFFILTQLLSNISNDPIKFIRMLCSPIPRNQHLMHLIFDLLKLKKVARFKSSVSFCCTASTRIPATNVWDCAEALAHDTERSLRIRRDQVLEKL